MSDTFDTTNALSAMFLWLIFGFLTVLVNCDIQRFIKNNPIVMHSFGFVAFFFLFTLLDSKNKTSINNIWIKTFFVYILFVLMTKSKWYFLIPVLALLLLDQSVKKDILYREENGEDMTDKKIIRKKLTKFVNVTIIALIIIGAIHYSYLQRIQYGDKFTWFKFLLGVSKCKAK